MSRKHRQYVALTGCTGFVGSNLLDHLLQAGHRVRALVRRKQAPREGVEWILGSLDDAKAGAALVEGSDTLIHVAGLTKARRVQDYFDVNHLASAALFDAAEAAGVNRLINISSMAAREPQLSPYGASKRVLDDELEVGRWSFNFVSIRPPAIYGPGEKEILAAIKLARGQMGPALYPSPAPKTARAGWIHVSDLCQAIRLLVEAPVASFPNKVGELDDGTPGGYSVEQIACALAGDRKMPKIIYLPSAIRTLVGGISEMAAAIRQQAVITTRAHLTYLAHPDWSVHDSARLTIPGFEPRFNLTSGMQHAISWYREHGLLD